MCTLTWLREGDGYALFFNRDEKRTRKPAEPPELKSRGGVHYLAPTDADAGGTWIGVNEYGLTVCVLNHQPIPTPRPVEKTKSRGWLVDSLLDALSPADVATRIERADMSRYQPFILVALDARCDATTWTWAGDRVERGELHFEDLPLTTSSFDSERVRAKRRETFASYRDQHGGVNGAMLKAFHRQHDADAGATSVCMQREDARTVSFSTILVTGKDVAFLYCPIPPCESHEAAMEKVVVPRAALA